MTTFHEFVGNEGHAPVWPYAIRYDQEQEIETDVLVIGGGIAGCWAAISAARKGVRVALVEKSATIRSGAGGPGCDHWCDTAANPLSKVNPDEWAERLTNGFGGYGCGIGREIQCRENYDTLLELEKMGGKIRDTDDQFKGVEGRDEKTKFLISPRMNPFHDTNVVIRVWGTTFKPALKKECERLGVKIYDRVMATSLLTEKGIQGARVVGATGVNARTGEFMIFKAKATILCSSSGGSLWLINTELSGYNTMSPRAVSGDGIAMAWRAGAELTLMERSGIMGITPGFKHRWYTGAGDASYENVMLVDANGKELPIVTEPGWRQKNVDRMGMGWSAIRERVLKGEYALPFYGDFPSMPEIERKVVWNMLLEEECTGKIIVDTYTESGFDPGKDQLQNYALIEGSSLPQWREANGGGLVIDWDLKTHSTDYMPPAPNYSLREITVSQLLPEGMPAEKRQPTCGRQAKRSYQKIRFPERRPESTLPSREVTEWIGRNCTPESPARCSTTAANTRPSRFSKLGWKRFRKSKKSGCPRCMPWTRTN